MVILKPIAYYEPEQIASSHLDRDLEDAFVQAGYETIIVTPSPTRGIPSEIRKEYKNIRYEEKFNGKVKIFRIPVFKEGKNPIGRAWRYIWSSIKIYQKCIKQQNINVVFAASTPPTQGMMAAFIAKKLGVPFIFNLQDIFPDSLVHTGLTNQGSLAWKIGHLIEDFTYRNAKTIVVISQDFKTNLLAKKVPESKIEVIYNWIDTTKVYPITRLSNQLFADWRLNPSCFYVVYAGNFGNAQSVDTIIECAKLLQSNTGIRFVLVGSGLQEKNLKTLVLDYQLQNVDFFPLQGTDKLSSVYSLGDVGIVCCKKGLGRSAFPSKTWSYFAAGTPIIASYDLDSELSNIVIKNTLGLTIKPEDSEELAKAIIHLEEDKNLLRTMSLNARAFVKNNVSKKKSTEQYLDVLKKAEL